MDLLFDFVYSYFLDKSAPGFAIAHSHFFIAMSQKYALATGAGNLFLNFLNEWHLSFYYP